MATPSTTGFKIQVWPPSKTGHIRGRTPEDRAGEAEKLADTIEADVILYGNVQADTHVTSFKPEFYLSTRVVENAEELGGQFEFGKALKRPGSFDSPVTRKELRTAMETRAPALAQFVIGLSYFAVDRFEEALERFEAAAATEGWDDREGKELIFLFLGHTAGQLDDLDSAEGYYHYILDELNPEYARARLAAAEILFQRARAGGCEEHKVDAGGLYNAIKGFESALDAGDQPAYSDIDTKTAFLLGRAYLCLSQGLVADHWTDAEHECLKVINEYEGGNERVKVLAAEAHANLGFIYMPPEDQPDPEVSYRLAAEQYRKAIELSYHADRQAVFHLWLAWIHTRMSECDMAEEALANADEAYVRSARSNPEYEAFRAAVTREISSCQAPQTEPSDNNWHLHTGAALSGVGQE
jgi:tetratricopeptide (TPR) repeat protein